MRFATAIFVGLALFVIFVHPATSVHYANWSGAKLFLTVLLFTTLPATVIVQQFHHYLLIEAQPTHWADTLALTCARLC